MCRKEDDFGNVTTCPYFHGCCYVRQFDDLEGKLVVMAHEYLTLPKKLIAKPSLVVVDERFFSTLIRATSLPLERVTSQRPATPGIDDAIVADLTHDAGVAIRAVEAGKTMAEAGLTPDRLQKNGPARGEAGRSAEHLAGHALCRAAEPRPATAGDRGVPAGEAVAGARPGP